MQTETENTERERLLAILDFWHKIEFFIPYDLPGRAAPREGRSGFWLHAQTLEDDGVALRRPAIPQEKEIAGITLFLGVFAKSEIAEASRYIGRADIEQAEDEDIERGDLDGDTCFASLDLDAAGNPEFATFAISTLPWALGRSRKSGLSALDFSAFADSKRQLLELLQNFETQRRLDHCLDDGGGQPLEPAEILALRELLCDWAGFTPRRERPVAFVEIRFKDRRPERKALPPPRDDEALAEADDDSDVVERDIGILNSFFVEDIERAMARVRESTVPEPLRQYLTPRARAERIDLYSKEGRHALLEALNPRNLNRGRWLSQPHHAMSLMQQFAINSASSTLSETGLYSVNGPPGTGKTTLLRDMIADNIVRRARVLSKLERAGDAFDGQLRGIGDAKSLSVLKSDLTGFEMVVASSNNTAVENISRDLPKRRSIAESATFGYLQTVAHKVAAQKDNGDFFKLSDGDRPWGLIACALGKAGNRRAFKERFAFMPIKEGAKPTWSGPARPQRIWDWLKSYDGPRFAEAAQQFRAADDAVSDSIGRHARYADLHREVGLVPLEAFCRQAGEEAASTGDACRHAQEQCDRALVEMRAIEERLSRLQEDERLLDRAAPAWWQRLLPTAAGREHRDGRTANAQAQLGLRKSLAECERAIAERHAPALKRALRRREDAEEALRLRQAEWLKKREELDRLGEELGHPPAPERLDDLETDRFQIDGLWHTEELAGLRSSLLEAALALHEAWLAEVGRGDFRGNIFAINDLLAGKGPADRDHIPAIWQSLFMIVPVVSTTFASFSRQFDGLGPSSIGWLFVDEAGQAVPQAAVGALMRARRAMMIGDPLQIEPVFSLPSALIAALAALSPHTADGRYAPNRVSAQMLADAANRFGTTVSTDGTDGLWIGSPLRVHRRCIDPMFSLANRIAYRDKMVFGGGLRSARDDTAPFYGDSAWIDIKGKVSGRQTVPEQVGFVVDALTAICRRDGALPNIYIISPFKETRNALRDALSKMVWTDREGNTRPFPRKWLQERIGTVHTF